MNAPATAPILVGLGDREDAHPELDWAAREAELLHRDLHVVRVWDVPPAALPWGMSGEPIFRQQLHDAGQRRLERAERYLERHWPELNRQAELVRGEAWRVLSERAEQAELTVVGTRAWGPLRSLVIGSVGASVAAHTHRPVVIAREPQPDVPVVRDVLVGLDGAPATADMLRFAFDYAQRHHCEVHVVHCIDPSLAAAAPWQLAQPPFAVQAERWVASVVDPWARKYPDIRTHEQVVTAHPVSELVHRSRGRELLVVGNRNTGSRLGGLLGTVSVSLLHHAACPVAVVHDTVTGAA